MINKVYIRTCVRNLWEAMSKGLWRLWTVIISSEDVTGKGWIGLITQNWPICMMNNEPRMKVHEPQHGCILSISQAAVSQVMFLFGQLHLSLREVQAIQARSHIGWERTTFRIVIGITVLRKFDRNPQTSPDQANASWVYLYIVPALWASWVTTRNTHIIYKDTGIVC